MPASRCPSSAAAAATLVAVPSRRLALPQTLARPSFASSASVDPRLARPQRSYTLAAATAPTRTPLALVPNSPSLFPHRSFSSSRAMASSTQLLQVRPGHAPRAPIEPLQADQALCAGHPRRQRDVRRRVRPVGPCPPQETRRRPESKDLLARLLRLSRLGRAVRRLHPHSP